MEAAPVLLKKEFILRVLSAKGYPYPILPGMTPSTRAQTQERLFKVFPDCTREGRGKTEKQQRSPEATAALELDGNLQN